MRDELRLSSEYSSLSHWKVAHNSLSAQEAYLNVIKYIFLRESSILNISDLVKELDAMYWKYANLVISRKHYSKNNESSEELRDKRARVREKQQILTVAIAHHRSISLDIVEGICRWRKLLQKDVKLQEIASLYWHGQNYLIKMLHDTSKLFDTQTMWMWLGFETDCFIVPPMELNPHSERLNRQQKFIKWKKKRDDHNTAQLKLLMSQQVSYGSSALYGQRGVLNHRNAGVIASPHNSNSNVSTDGDCRRRLASQAQDCSIGESQSTSKLPPSSAELVSSNLAEAQQHSKSSANLLSTEPPNEVDESMHDDEANATGVSMLAPRRKVYASASIDEGEVSETKTRDLEEESLESSSASSRLAEGYAWRELRDSCRASWDYFLKDRASDNVKTTEEPDFWENLELNEHMVEAAMGYIELYPVQYIVPPLKPSLMARCQQCEKVLREEVLLSERIKEKVAVSKEMKLEFDREKLQAALEALELEENELEKRDREKKLKMRQQKMKVRDQFTFHEISREYVTSLLRRRKPYYRFISSARSQRAPSGLPSSSPSRAQPRGSSPPRRPKNQNSFTVFLTAPSSPPSSPPLSFFPHNLPCKIEHAVLKEKMAAVVENDRQACYRIGPTLVLRAEEHRGNRARAYQNKPAKKRNALEAIVFMQALIRGVVTRSRLARKNKIQSRMAATMFLQRCLRRYVHRCRARVKRRLFRADCLRLRKEVIVAHRSSDIIKTFFRYLVFLKKRQYFLKKYASIAKLDAHRMRRVTNAVLIMQRIFRGFSVRNWFTGVLLDSRKRTKIGPKYKLKIIESSHRPKNFSVAGSGGFKYWWRDRPEMNGGRKMATNSSSSSVIREDSSLFLTSVDSKNDAITAKSSSQELYDREESHSAMHNNTGSTSQQLELTARSQELKKRSNIRGKIAMLKGGSKNFYNGVNLIKAAPTKEREFIHAVSKLSMGSVSSNGSFGTTGRSYTQAYESPNVHVKAKKARMNGLTNSLYSQSWDSMKKTSDLQLLLQDAYGFKK